MIGEQIDVIVNNLTEITNPNAIEPHMRIAGISRPDTKALSCRASQRSNRRSLDGWQAVAAVPIAKREMP